MKITKRYNQHRRDFLADLLCESCENEEKRVSCYDDRNFHDNVIPAMKCKTCKKSRNDLKIISEPPIQTRYAEHEIV